MNIFIKRILSIVLIMVMIVSITACGNETTKENGQKKLKEINVVLDWYPNALHAFIYDAIEKGYYEEEGLKVNINFPSNTNDALSLVAAGKAEIGLYYQHDAILAVADKKLPIKSIGAVVQGPLNIIMSLKEKNITSPKDLEGKTIGYAGTELSEALVKSVLTHENVDPNSVSMIDVGFDLMSSMTTNKVDATIGCLVNHEVPQMEEEGFEVNYFGPEQYGVPINYEGIFLANDKMINEDKETLVAFLRASKKGFEDMKNEPEKTLDILLNNQNKENFPLKKSVEMKSMQTLLPIMEMENAKFLSQDDAVWENNIKWMKDNGLIKNMIGVDDVRVNLE